MNLIINTQSKRQIIDITADVQKILNTNSNRVGVCILVVQHTTAALTTADLDPGTDADFIDFLDRITPDITYRHPHNPDHAPDHILASIIGPSITIPLNKGDLSLGTWQRIVLVELDGPRERSISITMLISDKKNTT